MSFLAFASKAWGLLIGNWKLVLAAIAAVLLSYNVGSCVGYGNGKRVMEKAIADANVRALQQKARADEMDFQSTIITAGMNSQQRNEGFAVPSQPGARG